MRRIFSEKTAVKSHACPIGMPMHWHQSMLSNVGGDNLCFLFFFSFSPFLSVEEDEKCRVY